MYIKIGYEKQRKEIYVYRKLIIRYKVKIDENSMCAKMSQYIGYVSNSKSLYLLPFF